MIKYKRKRKYLPNGDIRTKRREREETDKNANFQGVGERLYELLKNEDTKSLTNRQLMLLKNLVKAAEEGIKEEHLELLQNILMHCYYKIKEETPSFIKPLRELFNILTMPIATVKTQQIDSYEKRLIAIISVLTLYLSIDIPALKHSTLQAIFGIISNSEVIVMAETKYGHHRLVDSVEFLPLTKSICRILEETVKTLSSSTAEDIMKAKVEVTEEVQNNNTYCVVALFYKSLHILHYLSVTTIHAHQITESGGVSILTELLHMIDDLGESYLSLVLETIWQILEATDNSHKDFVPAKNRHQLLRKHRIQNPIYVLTQKRPMTIFCELASLFLMKVHIKSEKICRNELFLILYYITLHSSDNSAFIDSGLISLIVSYSLNADIGCSTIANCRSFATNCEEDFEWKQLCWSILLNIIKHNVTSNRENLSLEESGVLDSLLAESLGGQQFYNVLLLYISGEKTTSSVVHLWKNSQLVTLRRIALSLILHTVKTFYKELIQLNGHASLLSFIQDNEVDSTHMQIALSILVKICHLNPEEFARLGVVEYSFKTVNENTRPSTVIRKVLSLCSMCCINVPTNQDRFYACGGCDMLGSFLQSRKNVDLLRDEILLGVLEAIKCCIVGNPRNEEKFILHEGIYCLLDILEHAPLVVMTYLLSVLTELCNNKLAIECITSWRSEKDGKNVLQVALMKWKEEEMRQSTYAEMNKVPPLFRTHPRLTVLPTKNIPAALKEETKTRKTPEPKREISDTAAFTRLREALFAGRGIIRDEVYDALEETVKIFDWRMKIYCFLAAFGFSITNVNLSSEDEITLVGVKEYGNFKIGDCWMGVKAKLLLEGNHPIYPDLLYIEDQLERAYRCAVESFQEQLKIADSAKEQTQKEEMDFFDSIYKQKEHEIQMLTLLKSAKSGRKQLRH